MGGPDLTLDLVGHPDPRTSPIHIAQQKSERTRSLLGLQGLSGSPGLTRSAVEAISSCRGGSRHSSPLHSTARPAPGRRPPPCPGAVLVDPVLSNSADTAAYVRDRLHSAYRSSALIRVRMLRRRYTSSWMLLRSEGGRHGRFWTRRLHLRGLSLGRLGNGPGLGLPLRSAQRNGPTLQ